ncbi:SGNH/GDSL hydrolase family protein [Aureibaculum sp. 2210JD6-5]|uniref:SGNH/GDSL hydrolase family protein n=1 Tax=Aureibaculum sp. 2210JD6-5 TaxID=3103957 RepID=UPI002AAD47CC|nr:SGNH/GDSL hydrolase family protein [Aureibaculum sp. 2210JD6-5]MDY7395450.1 SGNH/GDSL hydrolase family protein [Aureibaculum sp. 2210JD6-5]
MKKFILLFLMFSIFSNSAIKAQDWPNLNKYKADNVFLGNPHPDEDRVVFMGNSITEGWLRLDSSFFSNKNYINRGISGQTTPQMLLRFRADVINLKPKAVVILAGTNDIAGNTGPMSFEMIMDNIISMTELAKSNNIKVVLSSVLPAYDYPWRKGLKPNEKIPALNKLIKTYADENDVVYLDYFSPMVDDKNGLQEKFTYDGVHPNKEGYQFMAPLAKVAIENALKN